MKQIKELLYILRHPSDGFELMKYNHTGSVILSLAIVLIWFVASVLERQAMSAWFNNFAVENTNVFYIFIATVVVFFFFTVANWSICTLFDGDGFYREIVIVVGYSLLPYVCSVFLRMILSQVMSLDESVFLNFITLAGVIYSVLLLVMGMMQIHRYPFLRLIIVLFFSVVGMLLIIFLCFLLIMLMRECLSFINEVIDELLMRNLV